jgi:hypothetical protein
VQTTLSARFPLGKGEVVSSILTSSMLESRAFETRPDSKGERARTVLAIN